MRGAVERPALYQMHTGDRVQDIIDRAGGALDTADTSDINLAAPLVDGTTLTIPELAKVDPTSRRLFNREEKKSVPNPPSYTLSGWSDTSGNAGDVQRTGVRADGLININSATQAELESLPGIGPSYAGAIIAYRSQHSFKTVEELTEVRGIGDKRFASIRPLVTIH